ncbi:hypothetical protein [Taibaiella koreensis]|uniref:hypothetical protein n=1 Tax=Taibaiella koreensis TaxID=1268548 RepID=UPI0013C2ECC5|nr:hypothetical protein [Taibaiella koreensis]
MRNSLAATLRRREKKHICRSYRPAIADQRHGTTIRSERDSVLNGKGGITHRDKGLALRRREKNNLSAFALFVRNNLAATLRRREKKHICRSYRPAIADQRHGTTIRSERDSGLNGKGGF